MRYPESLIASQSHCEIIFSALAQTPVTSVPPW